MQHDSLTMTGCHGCRFICHFSLLCFFCFGWFRWAGLVCFTFLAGVVVIASLITLSLEIRDADADPGVGGDMEL